MKFLFQEASQAEHLYRRIIDNALDAFIAIDQHSNILDWSMQAESVFGWHKKEVIGLRLTDTVIPQRYRAAHLAGVQHFLATGEGPILRKRVELSALRKDGTEIPVELTVVPISMPNRALFFASLRDISQRKALEEELHRQAGITTSILNSLADAVVVADRSEHL
ncbi:MAG TPA: PAS domain S-box protein, partial [Noviherbaspirillum sp.]|nr:PAS domain S-box protein [Noviherbaspirillum sp.]